LHGDCGSVTVAALVTLLERLSPEVVFAEIPKAHAARYADGSHGNLESLAVADFSRRHRVSVVPVDRDEPSEEFFRVTRELFELVERSSRDYRTLVDHQSECVKQGGLPFLNSSASAQALFNIHNEVRATIEWVRAPHLHAVYDMWLDEIELRDQEMLANITQYAAESALASGVFLVGAAHRKSIIEKVLSDRGTGRSPVEWQFELPSDLFKSPGSLAGH
jgi:hypothetical protein